jgi:hypothetical protein
MIVRASVSKQCDSRNSLIPKKEDLEIILLFIFSCLKIDFRPIDNKLFFTKMEVQAFENKQLISFYI